MNQPNLIEAAQELIMSRPRDLGDDVLDTLGDARLAPTVMAQKLQEEADLESSSSGEDTPVSRFRRDSAAREKSYGANYDDNNGLPETAGQDKYKEDDRPDVGSMSVYGFPNDEADPLNQSKPSKVTRRTYHSTSGTDDDEVTLHLEQAREAISAVTGGYRLSDDRIQQILDAAMRFEKDKAPTVATLSHIDNSNSTDSQPFVSVPSYAPSIPSFGGGVEGSTCNKHASSEGDRRDDDAETVKMNYHEEHSGSDHKLLAEKLHSENRIEQQALDTDESGQGTIQENGTAASVAKDGLQVKSVKADNNKTDDKAKSQVKTDSCSLGHTTRVNVSIKNEGDTVEVVKGLSPVPARGEHENTKDDDDDGSISSHEGDDENHVAIHLLNMPSTTERSLHSSPPGEEIKKREHDHEEEKKEISGVSVEPTAFDNEDSDPGDSDGLAIPEIQIMKSYSKDDSDVASTEGLPHKLQSTVLSYGRNVAMQRLDGVEDRKPDPSSAGIPFKTYSDDDSIRYAPCLDHYDSSFLDSFGLAFLWPGNSAAADDISVISKNARQQVNAAPSKQRGSENKKDDGGGYWNEKADEAFDLLGHCSAIVDHRPEPAPVPTSLVRVANNHPPYSYIETIRASDIDPRLQAWVSSHYEMREKPPLDGTYDLGVSRTVIVHEIMRGNWTWCTAWSPKGDRLAVATENHHLAVVETTASTVWRVHHDRRLKGPAVGDTTHSIRSLSWGKGFIAAGGTGNAVTIYSPIEPYHVVHVVKATGFVGSLDWKPNSNILAIGSRANKLLIVRVRSTDGGKQVQSETIYTQKFENWVNCVGFSPSGGHLAVGNSSGTLTVYTVLHNKDEDTWDFGVSREFQLDDSVLDLDWSPDGRWLYAGGEDFHMSVIETTYWEIVHKINRDRWVQCIASSNGGTHVAIGGVSSEISILDVANGWNSVMGIELKGLVPLSASWHPKDQALALTGQNNSVLVVETTNARHVKGHHLHSIYPIAAVGFSPDGRTAVVGNETGIVTFFSLSRSAFEVAYELVLLSGDRGLSIDWSSNGIFVLIGSKEGLVVVGPNTRGPKKISRQNALYSQCFSIQRVIRGIGDTNCVAIDSQSHYVAVAGDRTRVFDAKQDFQEVKSWKTGVTYAVAWSPDGHWLATIGVAKILGIYDTSSGRVDRWKSVFSLKCDFIGRALAWGPRIVGGLVYLTYGGADKIIYIMEIRTLEGTWETVLRIPRPGQIRALDWSSDGLLAAGIGDGTVSIIDLTYLLSGVAVNEKDYNWQRQALTCFTEIRRNRGRNSIQAVSWIPSAPGSDSLLALGGTDGEVEIVDLTARRRCRGYAKRRQAEPAAAPG